MIPLAFYNATLGKKFTGIRVRSCDRYTVSIAQAFKREVIMKPIGILILAGFIVPMFSKKRQGIHDSVAKTVVIEA